MKLKQLLIIIALLPLQVIAFAGLTPEQSTKFKEDLTYYLDTIKHNYAYFEQKETDWQQVSSFAWLHFNKVKNRTDFLTLIERLQIELYDNHMQLLNSFPFSPKVLPSSADIYAEYKDGKALVVNLMADSAAHKALEIGDEILKINDQPVFKALSRYVGNSFAEVNDDIYSWALNVVLAGDRGKERFLTIKRNQKTINIPLAETQFLSFSTPITSKRIDDFVYIRFNNSLGNNDILQLFPQVIEEAQDTNGLIIDLRTTPGGGNSLIARAILGHFIEQDHFYQMHESPYDQKNFGVKRSWVEIASPLKPYYSKPVMVLVNQWTGSMGEGIALGFDTMQNATVIGTKMAQLLGSMQDYRMPNTNIGFKVSTEKMFHVNGIPRENYRPKVLVTISTKNVDEVLEKALELLSQ